MPPAPSSTLIATLGTEAQVVTLALDCLLAKDEPVSRVMVLHTLPPDGLIPEAVERVRAEFSSSYYSNSIQLQLIEMRGSQGALLDVDSAEGAEVALQTIYRVLRQEKLDERRVHFCIAGGRKTMSLFGMAAAQMLFDKDDHLWHLITHGKLLEEKRMHAAEGEEAIMVEIPITLWSAISPALTDLINIDDPLQAVERQRALRLHESYDRARVFVMGSLSYAERRVVRLLVREGLGDKEIATRLGLSSRTVETELAEARRLAAAHWDLPDVTRTQLVALLALYFASNPD